MRSTRCGECKDCPPQDCPPVSNPDSISHQDVESCSWRNVKKGNLDETPWAEIKSIFGTKDKEKSQ